MTERDPSTAEGLTPAQSETVRRLLAGARHDEGMPDAVVARLDAVLEDLAAEGAEGAEASASSEEPTREAEVIPFRRRRWPQVLVAAAAVTVFGFGIAQMVGGGDADDGGAGSSSADLDVAPEVASSLPGDDKAVDGGSPGTAPDLPQNGVTDFSASALRMDRVTLSKLGIEGLRQLRPGSLDSDLDALTRASAETSPGAPGAYDARDVAVRCGPYYTVSGGESFAALYRRHLALVLFHPALDGARLVEIYDCESSTPRQTVRTVTLQTGE